jgi:hypothetical protein
MYKSSQKDVVHNRQKGGKHRQTTTCKNRQHLTKTVVTQTGNTSSNNGKNNVKQMLNFVKPHNKTRQTSGKQWSTTINTTTKTSKHYN